MEDSYRWEQASAPASRPCVTAPVRRNHYEPLVRLRPAPPGSLTRTFAEVGGQPQPVVVSTSGLRGTEDEPFSLLIIQLLQRA